MNSTGGGIALGAPINATGTALFVAAGGAGILQQTGANIAAPAGLTMTAADRPDHARRVRQFHGAGVANRRGRHRPAIGRLHRCDQPRDEFDRRRDRARRADRCDRNRFVRGGRRGGDPPAIRSYYRRGGRLDHDRRERPDHARRVRQFYRAGVADRRGRHRRPAIRAPASTRPTWHEFDRRRDRARRGYRRDRKRFFHRGRCGGDPPAKRSEASQRRPG